jgi:hypothetical protein
MDMCIYLNVDELREAVTSVPQEFIDRCTRELLDRYGPIIWGQRPGCLTRGTVGQSVYPRLLIYVIAADHGRYSSQDVNQIQLTLTVLRA